MEALFYSFLSFFTHWASVFWSTLRETAPFLVLGLLFAGMLHVLVPSRIILWALGQRGWRGALRGSLIGLPLPLCSCGVIPTALTLRRQGASLSATTAFTISTPETSIDALAITAALLPTIFLGVRPLAALILAVLVGVVVELFATTLPEQLRMNVMQLSRAIDGSKNLAPNVKAPDQSEICRVCGLMTTQEENHAHPLTSRVRAIFQYSFGTFFRDIATWLILGLLFAALIQILVPAEGLQWFRSHPALEVALAILAGIPLYSCATATTPLAAVLLAKGLSPGAALALLLSGPASNIGSVFALKRELGSRITGVYYGSLFLFCWLLGMCMHLLWPLVAQYPSLTKIASGNGLDWLIHGIPGWVEVSAGWLLLVLCANVWLKLIVNKIWHRDDECNDHSHHGHAH